MKPELLAPVNLKTLPAAVQAGADAVYLGGTSFGARKFADNFTLSDMEKAVDFCHLRGVKVYVTANILVSDSEIGSFLSFVRDAHNIGVDAFILQDLGMAELLKSHLPEARLHASTQLTVHNTDGAAFMKELGFERVVTARELSKEEISDITSSGIETEIFVHGALCMSYSGQCLMSSMIGGRSGNRGSCAQPCRLPYELYVGNERKGKGYYLSPRDLSLAGNMTEVFETEVSSLKIEGRMKGPEYVAASVSVLRRLIDEQRNCTQDELNMLQNAFSRNGFTSGLFTGDISKYINFSSGNDDIYKNRDTEALKDLKKYTQENANIKRIPVSFEAYAFCGDNFKISVTSMGKTVNLSGETVEVAQNKASDEDTIRKQLAKTGDFPFEASEIKVKTDGRAFLPLSEINALRRKSLELLSSEIVSSFKRTEPYIKYTRPGYKRDKITTELAVAVTNLKQLEIARKSGVKRVFAPCEFASADEVAIFPDIIHNNFLNKYFSILENTKSQEICTANYAIIKYARRLGKKIITSASLNVFNSESINFWTEFGVSEVIVSQELNLKQIEKLNSQIPVGVIAYGKSAMMKTAVCPVKAAMKKCGGSECGAYLKDRKNEKFSVICNGMTSFILNSKPIYMADKLYEMENAGVKTALLQFTDESPAECRKVMDAFIRGDKPEDEFTRGHFYRGVT